MTAWHDTLNTSLGATRWTLLDQLGTVGTARKHSKALKSLAKLAQGALDDLAVETRDERDERETVLIIADRTLTIETEKADTLDDTALEGLSAALAAAGASRRYAWIERDGEVAVACLEPSEVAALQAKGLTVTLVEPEEDEGEGEGGLGGWRRPTRADVPGADADAAQVRVDGPGEIGPVAFKGAAVVTFDRDGAVDQVRSAKGPLTLAVSLAGETVTVQLKGRAELRDAGWRAWGALAKDLSWEGGEVHAGDEIDVVDGRVAGLVLQKAGTIHGRSRKAASVVDLTG